MRSNTKDPDFFVSSGSAMAPLDNKVYTLRVRL